MTASVVRYNKELTKREEDSAVELSTSQSFICSTLNCLWGLYYTTTCRLVRDPAFQPATRSYKTQPLMGADIYTKKKLLNGNLQLTNDRVYLRDWHLCSTWYDHDHQTRWEPEEETGRERSGDDHRRLVFFGSKNTKDVRGRRDRSVSSSHPIPSTTTGPIVIAYKFRTIRGTFWVY